MLDADRHVVSCQAAHQLIDGCEQSPVSMQTSAPVQTLVNEEQHSLAAGVSFHSSQQELQTLAEAYKVFVGEAHLRHSSHHVRCAEFWVLTIVLRRRIMCAYGSVKVRAPAAASTDACCGLGWVRQVLHLIHSTGPDALPAAGGVFWVPCNDASSTSGGRCVHSGTDTLGSSHVNIVLVLQNMDAGQFTSFYRFIFFICRELPLDNDRLVPHERERRNIQVSNRGCRGLP
jgi:hypothetical protein